MMIHQSGPEAATKFLSFVNASPTPFHAIHNASVRLENAGFRKIKEKDDWEKDLTEGGKYYFTRLVFVVHSFAFNERLCRNQSALLAFTLPKEWKAGAGLSIVATHVDSPNLRVRPVSKRTKAGYLQVGVETYGGGIWHSWLDRDLSLAGRVVVASPNGFTSRLVKVDKPLIRIPTLAIHLDRNVNESLKFNQETEFVPILGLVESQLNAQREAPSSSDKKPGASSVQGNHHSQLLALLAEELSIKAEEIHDFELHLYDTQPSVLGGINNEFIFSPRMDNQFSSFAAVEALAQWASSTSAGPLEGNVNCIALFNHEEVGSVSTSGADSSLIPSLFERLSPTPAAFAQSIAKSLLVSADMGHALHPNYLSKHEDNHQPRMNGGIVIKTNAKQRYASDAIGTFLVKKLVERKGGQVQEYEVRNDMACGSTVGPMLSKIGVRTVDVGCAQLSMHSIRETAGSHDVQNAIDLFTSLFEGFSELDKQLSID
ncbi:aspartyl aminopeptidase [Punctularia strigosozonata HHB-11173 SS5]|uniref:aspartyl aminopeptidase n=1 Tax=Punctularia strigosozonata (strain HHB-11173) TaxID=741275 RepID=UPI0004416BA2|nr:aspartyl aminopeptidase [Punctularia strigosozonata HHB-11173 SS5]EIN10728.1 aspartyl aminopeptidase [Punctularia strigosozonata HHB-11173 SS5]